jgi:hypothetical protein
VLESGGKLYIIEPSKRWLTEENENKLEILLESNGFKIVEKTMEKFCLLVGMK